MSEVQHAEIILIRHALVAEKGRLTGRFDLPADLSDRARIAALAARLPSGARLTSSPAQRCVMTARALFPASTARLDDRLWEQSFGEWEGLEHGTVPDLGPLGLAQLAEHRPPGGESFRDLCSRTTVALQELASESGTHIVTGHAGTVRAALAHATGSIAGALSFQVAPLSLTRFQIGPGGQWSVVEVNWQP
jgi:alpha-ribazole phosphatase